MHNIKNSIAAIKDFMEGVGKDICNESLQEAFQDAVESMTKDIALKPVRITVGKHDSTDGCPVCRKEFYEKEKFCPRCGTPIDWTK